MDKTIFSILGSGGIAGLHAIYDIQHGQYQAAVQQEAANRAVQDAKNEFEKLKAIHAAKVENSPSKWGDFEDAEIIEDSRALEHK